MRKGPFSAAEDAYLRAHYDDEYPVLAATMQRKPDAIRHRVHKLGLKRTSRAQRRPAALIEHVRSLAVTGLSDRKVADQVGCSEELARKIRDKLGIARKKPPRVTLTEEQRAEFSKLRRRGYGPKRIAEEMGLSLWVAEREVRDTEGQVEHRRINHREAAFVRELNRLGGLPRAEVIGGRLLWLGPDDRPWFDPDRRRAA